MYIPVFAIAVVAFMSLFSVQYYSEKQNENDVPDVLQNASSTFQYTFNVAGVFEESGSIETSASKYFWLNSGAKLIINNGVGSTIVGPLPHNDPWYVEYRKNNSLDTENGAYPQNLFRLLTRNSWFDFEQELDFILLQVHAISSHDRDAYSGIFLMSRYVDNNNLYYAGIRMDGYAVIKKKYKGTYYTLAEKKIFTSNAPYNRITFPNLIPTNVWFRMASKTESTDSGTIRISLLFTEDTSKPMEVILTAIDTGTYGQPIQSEGLAGIRTDYADVQFDNYFITDVQPFLK